MSSTNMVLLCRLLLSAWQPGDPSPNKAINGGLSIGPSVAVLGIKQPLEVA